ncbi:TPA: magnesium transporter MgtE [Pyrococcus horikoshii]|uniref:Magnesium transporter MgtE n=1 Tax=Pyrococcus horikoshii TaxID=53953 RepID=A0A832T2I7_PYRHR|nr:magnesium transporter MgtE [Pyrococcus horikoshii]
MKLEKFINSELVRNAFLVSFPALLFCILLDFFAGAFLGKFFSLIRRNYPIILVMLPGLMGMRGNIFGAMASRLSTLLYLGEIEPKLMDRTVLKNVFLSIMLSLVPMTMLWIIGAIKVRELEVAIAVLLIVFVSTIYTSFLLGSATALATILPYKKGADPDAIAAPVITSIADLVTIPLLVGFILLYSNRMAFMGVGLVSLAILVFLKLNSKLEKSDIKTFRELLSILIALALFSSIAGTILESYSKLIEKVAILSIMYPMILDTTGNLGAIIGAKTSTKLHLEGIEKIINIETFKEILVYSLLALPLALVGNVIGAGITRVILSVEATVMPTFIILYPLFTFGVMWMAYFIAILAERANLDPDNVTVPTITTLSDIFSTLFIVLLAHLIS